MKNHVGDFKINQINSPAEEVAVRLRHARRGKNLTLQEASEQLNINIRYLTALENGRWQDLPSGLYGKNFLCRYGEFLGLATDELISLYSEEEKKISSKPTNLFSRKMPKSHYLLALPKIIRSIVVFFLILLCLGYLGYYVSNITKPPKLIITNPAQDVTVDKGYIIVRGLTESETDITINGEKVLPETEGEFFKRINLKEGVNTITIIAQKKHSRKNIITRKVLLKNNSIIQ